MSVAINAHVLHSRCVDEPRAYDESVQRWLITPRLLLVAGIFFYTPSTRRTVAPKVRDRESNE